MRTTVSVRLGCDEHVAVESPSNKNVVAIAHQSEQLPGAHDAVYGTV